MTTVSAHVTRHKTVTIHLFQGFSRPFWCFLFLFSPPFFPFPVPQSGLSDPANGFRGVVFGVSSPSRGNNICSYQTHTLGSKYTKNASTAEPRSQTHLLCIQSPCNMSGGANVVLFLKKMKSKNWSKGCCFWMHCMLPYSHLLNSFKDVLTPRTPCCYGLDCYHTGHIMSACCQCSYCHCIVLYSTKPTSPDNLHEKVVLETFS